MPEERKDREESKEEGKEFFNVEGCVFMNAVVCEEGDLLVLDP